jgi:hypothetical protein
MNQNILWLNTHQGMRCERSQQETAAPSYAARSNLTRRPCLVTVSRPRPLACAVSRDTPYLSFRAKQDVHLQLLLHVAVCAFLSPGRRPPFRHHDRLTQQRV